MGINEQTVKEEVAIARGELNLESIPLEDAVALVKRFLENMGVDILR